MEKQLKEAGYIPDGRLDNTEMKQIRSFIEFIGIDASKNAILKTLAAYGASGKSIEQARMDMDIAKQINPKDVLIFLSDRDISGKVSVE